MSKRARFAGCLLPLVLGAVGCGYQVLGSQGVGTTSGLELWLGPIEDEGAEPLFGARLAQALAREAVDRADTALVGRERARSLLTVRVDSVVESGTAYTEGDIVQEYVLVAEVTATLAQPGGAVLWRGRAIRADRDFPAGATVNETEVNKDRAIALLTRDLSREILRRVSLVLNRADS
jgi:outer membrane lipopolysaccharide assembly protein LptE/RlpB